MDNDADLCKRAKIGIRYTYLHKDTNRKCYVRAVNCEDGADRIIELYDEDGEDICGELLSCEMGDLILIEPMAKEVINAEVPKSYAWEFIEKQLNSKTPASDDKTGRWRYGKCELRELLDYIYGKGGASGKETGNSKTENKEDAY